MLNASCCSHSFSVSLSHFLSLSLTHSHPQPDIHNIIYDYRFQKGEFQYLLNGWGLPHSFILWMIRNQAQNHPNKTQTRPTNLYNYRREMRSNVTRDLRPVPHTVRLLLDLISYQCWWGDDWSLWTHCGSHWLLGHPHHWHRHLSSPALREHLLGWPLLLLVPGGQGRSLGVSLVGWAVWVELPLQYLASHQNTAAESEWGRRLPPPAGHAALGSVSVRVKNGRHGDITIWICVNEGYYYY